MVQPDTLPYIASQLASDDFIMIVISVGGETMITDINEIIHQIRCAWLLATGYSIDMIDMILLLMLFIHPNHHCRVITKKRLDQQIIITFLLPR